MRLVGTSARRGDRRRGASAVEFAVILPVLLLIVVGCVDFGRVMYLAIALTNSARAGAEYGIMNPYTSAQQGAWQSQIQQTAQNEMTQQTGYDPSKLSTSATVTIESTGLRRVRVQATYTSFQTLVSWPGIPHTLTLQRAIEMRVIR